MEYYGDSIVGKRKTNEDSFLAIEIIKGTYCFAVADGMGGADYGEIASKMAIQHLERFLKSIFTDTATNVDLKKTLADSYQYVQERIISYIDENPDYSRMGTTLTVLLIDQDKYVCGNIGDSRIYRIYSNIVEPLTKDHTLLQQMIDKDEIITAESRARYSHLLTRCISAQAVDPDIYPLDSDYFKIYGDERFLLCSDGLILNKEDGDTNNLLLKNFKKYPSIKKLTTKLIRFAYQNGSEDNITAIVVRANDRKSQGSFLRFSILKFLTFAIIILALFIFSREVFLNHISGPEEIPTIGSPAKEMKISWLPFEKDYQTSRKNHFYLNWQPLPEADLLKYYRFELRNESDSLITIRKIRKNKILHKLNLKNFPRPAKYYISLKAYTMNDTIKGNELTLFLEEVE